MKQKIHILLNAKCHLEEESFRWMHSKDAMLLKNWLKEFASSTAILIASNSSPRLA
jgi:hypothetical protein